MIKYLTATSIKFDHGNQSLKPTQVNVNAYRTDLIQVELLIINTNNDDIYDFLVRVWC